jgi:hypothetical protein
VNARKALSRRQFLRLLVLLASRSAFAAEKKKGSGDNGIGGTGYKPGDNGIGGTGFIGTIRKFGSVYINGERIAYPPDVRIEIDGASAAPSDMRLGQVARLVAERRNESWMTNGIVIVSEVVGAIRRIDGGRLEVLGQSVELTNTRMAPPLSIGDRVAVSGLRRPDQTIVASLIEKRESGLDQIAGVLTQDASGEFRIGSQIVTGASGAVIGERLVTRGAVEGGAFVAQEVKIDTGIGIGMAQRFSIETWLTRRDGALVTANGVKVEASAGGLPHGPYHVVINGELGPNGSLIARQVEFPNQRGGFAPPGAGGGPGGGVNGPGAPGGGPGGGPIGPGGSPTPGGGSRGGLNEPARPIGPVGLPGGGGLAVPAGPGGFLSPGGPAGLGNLPAPGAFPVPGGPAGLAVPAAPGAFPAPGGPAGLGGPTFLGPHR